MQMLLILNSLFVNIVLLIKFLNRNNIEAFGDTWQHLKLGVKLVFLKIINNKYYRQPSYLLIALYEVTCVRLQKTSSDQA